jgi:cytoskeletal protein CcmA (bactofilin family)
MLKRKDKIQIENSNQLNRLVEGTKIAGDVITNSSILVEGEIVGNIFSRAKVIISQTGSVFGNISCLEADIEGSVDGSLEIENLLVLRDKAKIIGDIITSKLHIEEGAIFLGSCQMKGYEDQKSHTHLTALGENSDDSNY